DALDPPVHPPIDARSPAYAVARVARHRDLSLLHLDHLVTGHLDVDEAAAGCLLEGLGRDVGDLAVYRLRLSIRRRILHGLSLSRSGRGRLLLQSRRPSRLAL